MKNSSVGSRKSARATVSSSSPSAATETIVASNSRSVRVHSQTVDNKRKEKKAKVAEPDTTQTQDEREEESESGSESASRNRASEIPGLLIEKMTVLMVMTVNLTHHVTEVETLLVTPQSMATEKTIRKIIIPKKLIKRLLIVIVMMIHQNPMRAKQIIPLLHGILLAIKVRIIQD